MNEIEAIITLARRYCLDNYKYWVNRYTEEKTGNDFPLSYTDNDYKLFPRYNVLFAILSSIELIVGTEFNSIDECMNEIIYLGLNSNSIFTNDPINEIERQSILDERNKFIEYIKNISGNDLCNVKSLPYKRRFSADESTTVRNRLKKKWEFDGSYWFPLISLKNTQAVFLSKENILQKDYHDLYNYVIENSIERIFMITEDLLDYEIDNTEFEPDCYEIIYTDKNLDWIIYGSHESTLAFAGDRLIDFVFSLYRDRKDLINKW